MKLKRQGENYTIASAFGPQGAPARYDIDGAGKILSAGPETSVAQDGDRIVTPGMVDIQVNGFAGIDFNAPGVTPERMDEALAGMLATGVTRCLPTLITAGQDELVALLSTLDDAVSRSNLGPLMVPGYHIEGPFMSPEEGYVGAHPAAHMRSGSSDLVVALQRVATRPIKLMTVAPEIDGVIDLIAFLRAQSITCAIGHSGASRAQIDAAIAAGASMSTHLGNGMPHMLNKNESSLLVQLGRDQLMASFIADGIHIPSDILQSWLRAKTLDRAIIVTDASAAAGAPATQSQFTIGAQAIFRHKDGSVRLPGSSYLAGSAASMDEMVRNVMQWYGFSMSEVIRLTRINPLRAIGLSTENPRPAGPADFVEWDMGGGHPHVVKTVIGPWSVVPE
tara:strand:- start:4256 stop:5434 length:1179 start_codon:yes stop_codon:yes gene_type:complete